MTSSTLRSTKTLTNFVRLSDEAKTLATRLKEVERELTALTPEILETIQGSRAVKIGTQIRLITEGSTESIKRTCTDEVAVEFCRANGLKFSTRSPEYVAPATFSALVRSSQMHVDYYLIDVTRIVIVT
jgi:hypothetical protein